MYPALVSVGYFSVSKVIEIFSKIFHLVFGVKKESNLKTRSEHPNARTSEYPNIGTFIGRSEHQNIQTWEHPNIRTFVHRNSQTRPKLLSMIAWYLPGRLYAWIPWWLYGVMCGCLVLIIFFRSMRTLKRGYLFNLAFHSPTYVHEDWQTQNQTSLKQHFHPDWHSWKTIRSHNRGECLSARPYIRLSNRSTEGWHRTKNYTYKERCRISLPLIVFHDTVHLTADAERDLTLNLVRLVEH